MRHRFRYLLASAPTPGDVVQLDAEDARHLTRVVRRTVGDAVEVLDGRGGLWAAEVVDVAPARVRVGAPREVPAAPEVTLYVGTLDRGRLDTLVEKVGELGAREVVLFSSARSRRVPSAADWTRRRERLDRVAAAALRQSGRAMPPALRGVVPFDDILREVPAEQGVLLDHDADEPLSSALVGRMPVRLIVGPDAGFERAEVDAARAAGLTVAGLGEAMLRTETAAIAALTLALDASGFLGVAP